MESSLKTCTAYESHWAWFGFCEPQGSDDRTLNFLVSVSAPVSLVNELEYVLWRFAPCVLFSAEPLYSLCEGISLQDAGAMEDSYALLGNSTGGAESSREIPIKEKILVGSGCAFVLVLFAVLMVFCFSSTIRSFCSCGVCKRARESAKLKRGGVRSKYRERQSGAERSGKRSAKKSRKRRAGGRHPADLIPEFQPGGLHPTMSGAYCADQSSDEDECSDVSTAEATQSQSSGRDSTADDRESAAVMTVRTPTIPRTSPPSSIDSASIGASRAADSHALSPESSLGHLAQASPNLTAAHSLNYRPATTARTKSWWSQFSRDGPQDKADRPLRDWDSASIQQGGINRSAQATASQGIEVTLSSSPVPVERHQVSTVGCATPRKNTGSRPTAAQDRVLYPGAGTDASHSAETAVPPAAGSLQLGKEGHPSSIHHKQKARHKSKASNVTGLTRGARREDRGCGSPGGKGYGECHATSPVAAEWTVNPAAAVLGKRSQHRSLPPILTSETAQLQDSECSSSSSSRSRCSSCSAHSPGNAWQVGRGVEAPSSGDSQGEASPGRSVDKEYPLPAGSGPDSLQPMRPRASNAGRLTPEGMHNTGPTLWGPYNKDGDSNSMGERPMNQRESVDAWLAGVVPMHSKTDSTVAADRLQMGNRPGHAGGSWDAGIDGTPPTPRSGRGSPSPGNFLRHCTDDPPKAQPNTSFGLAGQDRLGRSGVSHGDVHEQQQQQWKKQQQRQPQGLRYNEAHLAPVVLSPLQPLRIKTIPTGTGFNSEAASPPDGFPMVAPATASLHQFGTPLETVRLPSFPDQSSLSPAAPLYGLGRPPQLSAIPYDYVSPNGMGGPTGSLSLTVGNSGWQPSTAPAPGMGGSVGPYYDLQQPESPRNNPLFQGPQPSSPRNNPLFSQD